MCCNCIVGSHRRSRLRRAALQHHVPDGDTYYRSALKSNQCVDELRQPEVGGAESAQYGGSGNSARFVEHEYSYIADLVQPPPPVVSTFTDCGVEECGGGGEGVDDYCTGEVMGQGQGQGQVGSCSGQTSRVCSRSGTECAAAQHRRQAA